MLQSPFVLEITKKVGTSLPGQPFQVESWDGFESHVLFGLGTHWLERSGTHRVFAERFGGGCVEPQTDDKGRQLTCWSKNDGKTTYQFAWMFEKSWKKMGSLYR